MSTPEQRAIQRIEQQKTGLTQEEQNKISALEEGGPARLAAWRAYFEEEKRNDYPHARVFTCCVKPREYNFRGKLKTPAHQFTEKRLSYLLRSYSYPGGMYTTVFYCVLPGEFIVNKDFECLAGRTGGELEQFLRGTDILPPKYLDEKTL